MSLFGLNMSHLEVDDERMRMAELDFDSLTMLFGNLLTTCRTKCIQPRYGEEELLKGEMMCIDRCVSKYFSTNLKVGQFMRENGYNASNTTSIEKVLPVAANAFSKG